MHESVGTPSTSTVQAPQWPFVARDLRAGERELVAQRLRERRADLGVHLVDVVVDGRA